MKQLAVVLVMLTLTVACSKQETTVTEAPAATSATVASHEMTPEQLGELGAQIRKQPDQAEKLLSQHGMTLQQFEAAIRKVTEDPDASKRYTEAYRKASA